MTKNQFWHIASPSSGRLLAEWDEGAKLEQVFCPVNPGHQRSGKRLTDLSVVLPDFDVGDFTWTWHGECMIADRALQLFRSRGFTGFDVKPVKARFATLPVKAPKLWEVVLTGWAGIARRESGIQLDRTSSCDACGHLRYTGLQRPDCLIDERQWDGNDFFMLWPLPAYIFASQRVVDAIREHHLVGARILPVDKLSRGDGYSPGRLSYWMPEDRARELGGPLGID